MTEFRRKASLVRAVQWFPDVAIEGVKPTAPQRGELTPRAIVQSKVGPVFAKEGDWVIFGDDGRMWVCEQSEFRKLYEPF